jgi:hypothetical protein
MHFLHSFTKPLRPEVLSLIGTLQAAGITPWMPCDMLPNGFFAQLQGTSGTITATAAFEWSNDGQTVAATDPNAFAFSATGGAGVIQAKGTSTFNPWTPFKYVRLNCSAMTGTGAQLQAFQMVGN